MGGSRALAQGWPLVAGQLIGQTPAPINNIVIALSLSSSSIAEDAASSTVIGVLTDITGASASRPTLSLSNLTIAEDAVAGTNIGSFL